MKRWYVVQVYAGYEDAVKRDLLHLIESKDAQEFFGEILIPSAKVKQMFELADQKDQQLFPGYVLIEMEEQSPEAIRLVTSSPRILRFLGGTEPVSLTKKEVERIVSQMKGEIAVGVEAHEFAEGSEVEIEDGPFAGFVGIVEKIDTETDKLTVMVSIFGRMTPVELGFHQVKR